MAGVDSYTKLMFHCQRPDATLPKAVTFGGTAALDTAQYKFGTASLLLDGNSDYITVPDSADWDLAANFTADCWVRMPAVPSSGARYFIFGYYDGNTATDGDYFLELLDDSGVKVRWGYYYGGWGFVTSDALTISADTWYHFAIVRNGSELKIYQSGVEVASGTDSVNHTRAGALPLGIGGIAGDAVNFAFNGWIDSFRWSKGIARWTAAFTPPDSQMLSDANTQLLLNFDGADGATATYDSAGGDETYTTDHAPTFVNQATYDTTHAVSFVGTAALDTAQKKFGTASLLLDGDSDYLTVPDSTDWIFGNSPFTIDCWVRFAAVNAEQCIYHQGSGTNDFIEIYYDNSPAKFQLYFVSSGTGLCSAYCTFSPNADQWYHLAVVRNGTDVLLFIDGVLQTTTYDTAIGTNSVPDYGAVIEIGRRGVYNDQFFNGWIDALRISKGYARWTADFSVPTTAPVADTRTQLLLNFNDGVDGAQATNNEIGSLTLDGNADYVTIADSADWDFGTGDFTIDFWYKILDTAGGLAISFCSRVTSGSSYFYWSFEGAGTRVRDYGGGGSIDFNNTLSVVTGQWFHMALTRKGTNFRTFQNGVQYGSTYSNAAGFVDRGDPFIIGAMTQNSAYVMKGWMREFRVTKGIARWTADFTPPVDLYTFGPDPAGTPTQGSMSTNTGYWGGIL